MSVRTSAREKVLDKVSREQYAQGRKGGLKRSLMDQMVDHHFVVDDSLRSSGSASAETVGRWRASRKLARKLHEQLTQMSLDAARETCYSIVMQLDALQRGRDDG